MTKPLRVGFLTYDLQEFTADCLSRINDRAFFRLKAYPILPRAAKERINFEYRPSTFKARHFSLCKEGKTPEGLMASVNVRAAVACARENDVVVLFGIQGGTALLVTAVARLLRRKLVSVNQTLPVECERNRRAWVRWLKGMILRRCQVHVVETPVTQDTLATVYGLPRRDFVEAPFEAGFQMFTEFIAENRFDRNELRAELGWNENECVFLFAGTLLRFKGIETILRASSLLKETSDAFRVVLCGADASIVGDPTIKEYRLKAERLGVGSHVVFAGSKSLPDLARHYMAANAFILPTQRDMWPKTLVEAAACRLPLITTTSCGAAGSLVRDGVTGYVVPPEDPESLAVAMESLLDRNRQQRMGQAAYEFCTAFCDPVKQADGYVEAVRRVA
ncbi:MAG: glycosyltransferase family 4 protein [Candidatus Nealsonbacteria bacterium]|nr:glycosyltransferase family 4 protein [Candidatus Nealsonbacteria bacterium]